MGLAGFASSKNMGTTGFSEHFVGANGLGERDFEEWVLCPGMLFGASGEWWGDRRRRRTPHEGLDLCYYADGQGGLHGLDEGARIPVLYDGVVVCAIDDFLGKSLIVNHDLADIGTARFCTIYAHTEPESGICTGRMVVQGEAIARVAGVGKSKSRACPHVHISAGMVSSDTPWGELDWQNMGDPGVMTLMDPLQFVDRYRLVEDLRYG
jgi:hypothetical protein